MLGKTTQIIEHKHIFLAWAEMKQLCDTKTKNMAGIWIFT